MTPNDDKPELILPSLVPVEQRLILPPGERENIEAERAAMLAELEAMEEERRAEDPDYDLEDDTPPALADRVRHGICRQCGKRGLCWKPANWCERCLKRAAREMGVEL